MIVVIGGHVIATDARPWHLAAVQNEPDCLDHCFESVLSVNVDKPGTGWR